MTASKAVEDILSLSRPFWWETERTTRLKAYGWLVGAAVIMNVRSRVALWASRLRSKQLNELVALAKRSGEHRSNAMLVALVTLLRYSFASSLNYPLRMLSFRIRRALRHQWVTHLTKGFLANFVEAQCLHLGSTPGTLDPAAQPDQRISEDIDKFVSLAITLFLDAVEGVIHLKTYLVELLSISPSLALCAILGAVTTTSITSLFSRRLQDLYCEERRTAGAFTYTLTRLRENAESIAFYGGQHDEVASATKKLHERQDAEWRRFGLKDIVQAFANSYQSILRAFPMVALPLLARNAHGHHSHQHEHGFGHESHGHGHSHGHQDPEPHGNGLGIVGTVNQATEAFQEVLEHCSIIANNMSDFTRLAAVARELSQLQENSVVMTASSKSDTRRFDPSGRVEDLGAWVTKGKSRDSGEWLRLEGVTISLPDGRLLVKQLSFVAPAQGGMLVSGVSGVGKTSLLRAIAGLWPLDSGSIMRHASSKDMMFLPQRPYSTLGTLRDQLVYPFKEDTSRHSDAKLIEVLEKVGLRHVLSMCSDSLDEERCWSEELSVGEQQRVAVARVLVHQPKYVFLDEATSACDLKTEANLYSSIAAVCIAWVSVGHRKSIESFHHCVLELEPDLTHDMRSLQ